MLTAEPRTTRKAPRRAPEDDPRTLLALLRHRQLLLALEGRMVESARYADMVNWLRETTVKDEDVRW
jgi:hypothetical protein